MIHLDEQKNCAKQRLHLVTSIKLHSGTMLWMGEIRDYNRGLRRATNSWGLEKREKKEREREIG